MGGRAPPKVKTRTVKNPLKAEHDALKLTNKKLNDDNATLKDENQSLKGDLKISKNLVAVQSSVIQMYMKKSTADEKKIEALTDIVSTQNEFMKEMDDILDNHKKLLKAGHEESEFQREAMVEHMEDHEDSEESEKASESAESEKASESEESEKASESEESERLQSLKSRKRLQSLKSRTRNLISLVCNKERLKVQ